MVVWPHQARGGGGRGLGVPGAPWKEEIVREEHLLRKVLYPWGRAREAGPRPPTWGTDSVTRGGDRVAGQELPCWGRGAGVLNLGG